MNSSSPHLVFAGGGTGGHLFPGLALAERLVDEMPRVRITFAGTGRQLERREVGRAGFEYVVLPCHPLPQSVRGTFSFFVQNLAGYLAAGRLLDEHCVAAVVGLGGYASVPMGRAASRRNLPLVLLEQNAVPGRATRWLARHAALVCVGLAQARAGLRCRCPVQVTGTPIRPGKSSQYRFSRQEAFPNPGARYSRDRSGPSCPQMIILGGSHGARSINQNAPRALYKIGIKLAGWQIVHQAGEHDLEATRQLYRKLGLKARVESFFARMPELLAASDLAVCRAGGTTLAELSAAGLPAVLLPYPQATDDHQRRNARVFSRAGGSVTLDRRELAGRLDDHLAEAIGGLLGDSDRLGRMSAAMRRLGRPHAAADVAALVLRQLRGDWRAALPAAA